MTSICFLILVIISEDALNIVTKSLVNPKPLNSFVFSKYHYNHLYQSTFLYVYTPYKKDLFSSLISLT